MLKPVDPEGQRKTFDTLCLASLSFCEKHFKEYDRLVSRRSAIDVALARLVVRQAEALSAVRVLRDNHTIEANMVVRHMYETMVNAVAIAFPIDPTYTRHQLAFRFIQFADIKKCQHLDSLLAHVAKNKEPLEVATPAQIRETHRRKRAAMRNLGVTKPPQAWHPWNNFAGLHRKVTAAIHSGKIPSTVSLGLDTWKWHNDASYRYASSAIHGDWSSMISRVDFTTNPPVLSLDHDPNASSISINAPTHFLQTLRCFSIHKGVVRRVLAQLNELL